MRVFTSRLGCVKGSFSTFSLITSFLKRPPSIVVVPFSFALDLLTSPLIVGELLMKSLLQFIVFFCFSDHHCDFGDEGFAVLLVCSYSLVCLVSTTILQY